MNLKIKYVCLKPDNMDIKWKIKSISYYYIRAPVYSHVYANKMQHKYSKTFPHTYMTQYNKFQHTYFYLIKLHFFILNI
jgi:hypothetical protein